MIVEAGTRTVRPKLDGVTEVVKKKNRSVVSVEDADLHIELEHYKSAYKGGLGDPLSNGLGHRVCRLEGVLGVMVPGEPIRQVKRMRQAIVDVEETVDDGSLQLSETQAQDAAAKIFSGFSLSSRALGQVLSENLASEAPAQVTAARVVAPAGKTPSPSKKDVVQDGTAAAAGPNKAGPFDVEFVVPQLRAQELAPTVAGPSAKSSGSSGSSRGSGNTVASPAAAPAAAAPARKGGEAPSAARGRKKRNLVAEAKRVCQDFASCDRADKGFFGQGSKALYQWLQRLHRDFGERLHEATTQEEYNEHQVYQKGIDAILRVMKATRSHSAESEEVVQVVTEVSSFLAIEPQITFPLLPQFLGVAQLKLKLTKAPIDDGSFWTLLKQESLETSAMATDAIEPFQAEVISDKLTHLQKSDSDFSKDMHAWIGNLSVQDCGVVKKLLPELESLQIVACLVVDEIGVATSRWTPTTMQEAMDRIEDDRMTVAKNLLLMRPGRQLLRDAQGRLSAVRALMQKAQLVADKAKSLLQAAQSGQHFGSMVAASPACELKHQT